MKEMITKHLTDKIYQEHLFSRVFILLFGIFMMAISYNLLILPNNIVFGGVTGISILLKNYIDPALFILLSSLALLVLSRIFLGRRTTSKSVLGSIIFPLMVKLTQNIGNIIEINMDDKLLIIIFAGLLYGLGAGLVFKVGYTTGGTDILNQIYSKYLKVSLGTSMLIIDGAIVLLGLFINGAVNFMYGLVLLYLISLISDRVVLGISDKKAFYIVTTKEKLVSDYVISELNHSVTIFNAKGGYSDKKQTVLFVVIPTKDYFKLKEGLHMIDHNAFFVATDAYEVYGGE